MRQLKIRQAITNRDEQSLEVYLNEISKIPMITPEEECDLAVKIQSGDEKALNTLVKANLRFVVSVAKQYQHQGLPLSELINEGNLGAIKAAQRFDHTKGFKFISYAVRWIRQSILQALGENGRLVRLPSNKIGIGNKIEKTVNSFLHENNYEPTAEQIAEALEMSLTEVEMVMHSRAFHTSLDAPINPDSTEGVMGDFLRDESAQTTDEGVELKRDDLKYIAKQIIKILPDGKPREVIRLHYGIGCEPQGLEKIAHTLGLGIERVRQIKEAALTKLRKSTLSKKLVTGEIETVPTKRGYNRSYVANKIANALNKGYTTT